MVKLLQYLEADEIPLLYGSSRNLSVGPKLKVQIIGLSVVSSLKVQLWQFGSSWHLFKHSSLSAVNKALPTKTAFTIGPLRNSLVFVNWSWTLIKFVGWYFLIPQPPGPSDPVGP